ncbi:ImmA/IrrE family metallo-endopeptidase [Sciscionella sediminilitoris]|uniref:ImmA/IrrE family metallo-endopeptidase n=1 Tax=Sciscionella sediminilitoris TaxID=1445613 RepID=UPI0004DFAE60|nr:ImmA/IrrE family metallo-endopeptidase [Sciscionella sp. SE31]
MTDPEQRHEQLRRIREECAGRIAELDLHEARDVRALCDHLVELRGRPIRLVPLPLPASHPCGMWVAASDEDVIFYDANTTSAHQEHIILHELGHVICCHRGSGILDDESARALFPNIDPQIVRDMLGRATYDDVQEQEAEITAYLLAELIKGRPRANPSSPERERAIDRVERTLV